MYEATGQMPRLRAAPRRRGYQRSMPLRFMTVRAQVTPPGGTPRVYEGPVALTTLQSPWLRGFVDRTEGRPPLRGSYAVKLTTFGDGDTGSVLLYLSPVDTQEVLRFFGFTRAAKALRGFGADEETDAAARSNNLKAAFYIGGGAVGGFLLAWLLKPTR